MKIGLPKIRFSRKVLLISVGILALLAGSGAAALYVGAGDALMSGPKEESPVGGECKTIETLVLKTPAKRLWLRKYIRMDHASGSERIRTALRVAGLLAKSNAVDLVQVSVLDADGPTLKSRMRGRAIGAEVVIALQPKYLPDMKEPFIVRYYEGMPGDEGMYYGERVSLELPEIRKLVGAMKNVADKQDCTDLPRPDNKSAAHEGKSDHEQVVGEMGEKTDGHDAKPEHEAPAKQAADAEGHDAAPKKEPSFLDSVLSMVGLGASEPKPAESHEAKTEDNSHAVTDDAIDPAPASDRHAAEPDEHGPAEHAPAEYSKDTTPAEAEADAVHRQPIKAEDPAEKHVEAEPANHAAQPVESAH